MKAIRKPEFMKNAILGNGHGAAFELVCALLVFFMSSIVMSFVEAPVMAFYMLQDSSYLQMLHNNEFDMEKMMQIMGSLPDWFTIVNLVAEIGLIVVCILYCKLIEKRKPYTMGFCKKGCVRSYIKGMLIGAVAFLAAYGICILTKSISFEGLNKSDFSIVYLVCFLIGFLIQGMAEEVLCRGYLLVSLTRRHSVIGAVVLSSLFFSMLHGMNTDVSLLAYLNLFLFGVAMALMMIRYENIWIVGAAHSIWNFVQGNIFGVSVSGNSLKHAVFKAESVEGAAFMNGGGFGIEGGMGVTFILLVGIAFLIWSLSRKGAIIPMEKEIELRIEEEKERLRQVEEERRKKEEYMQKMAQRYQNTPYGSYSAPFSQNVTKEDAKEQNPWKTPEQQNPQNENWQNVPDNRESQKENRKTEFDSSYFDD